MRFWEQTSCNRTCRFNFGHFRGVTNRYQTVTVFEKFLEKKKYFDKKKNYSTFIDSL